ncbi:LacI family DNA-binding transcriptional regulator [Glycomyces algeriensis]|uniref:LacI family transcriptional regulator n=1 Tax=Glycomyces algeriensis TaxID=256037 RepID=A0A9W6GAC8_9ACTN|nr:LacI family DNA-binding transcriptional regulator [Glycomyces algeriensis]MDA1364408.1 LacI family DNA-binding transcriptional regulator [Glycomyces algeriensis]MDR7350441.1 DNA-binding LacI/PurR family transcriptional regulator [Glycomyces algeriensis]GLI43149.1 LacI family transcriptional regulator [Glycomyces algeriensis]
MSDVARLAGVSTMTVSNVVNNRVKVSEAARERVLEAIRASGYQVNLTARSLRSGRTGVIGVAVPQVGNPYYGMLGALLIDEAHQRGYEVTIGQTGALADGEAAAVAQSRWLQVDGLFLSAIELDPQMPLLADAGFPIVLFGEQGAGGRFDHITLPNEAGAAAATGHLIDQGCKRIAIVTGSGLDRLNTVTRRYNGYRAALEDRGLRPDPELRFALDSLSWDGAREAGRHIAASGLGVDGVVAFNDTTAIGVMRGLTDGGASVPGDVRVIGFDGIPVAEQVIPALSTVAPDHHWIAARALDLIVGRIADPAAPPRQYTAPFDLVVRESTA